MRPEIPMVVEELYLSFVTEPDPQHWPERLQEDPVKGHGLWSFYQGLKLEMRLSAICLDQL